MNPCVMDSCLYYQYPNPTIIMLQHNEGPRLTASSRVNTFLPILVIVCDAQIQPSKCDSYEVALTAYISFLSILKKPLRYKNVPYLMQSVLVLHLFRTWYPVNIASPSDYACYTPRSLQVVHQKKAHV